jgi:4-hydroxybenzoate polyprenyltransferase
VLTLLYSFVLKHQMLLDVIAIATLFVLRALSGAFAIGVDPSPWLLICTFMLCLFLGFGKRRCEIAMIGDSDAALRGHRATLVRYTPDLLNHLLSTSAGIAIVTFLLYTLDRTDVNNPFIAHKHHLIYTLPLVVYAIYRYAMKIEMGDATGPTDLLLKDKPIVITTILWGLSALFILYGLPRLH